jgi:hypothetical protein
VTRGAPGQPAVGRRAENKVAFQLGVRTVDLQIALERGDTGLAGRLTDSIHDMLTNVTFGEPIAANYDELRHRLGSEPLKQSIASASAVEKDLNDVLHSPSFLFAQWVGTASLAADMRDTSFFRDKLGMPFIRSAASHGTLAPEDTLAVQQIDARLSRGMDEHAMAELHAFLQQLIQTRGNY